MEIGERREVKEEETACTISYHQKLELFSVTAYDVVMDSYGLWTELWLVLYPHSIWEGITSNKRAGRQGRPPM